MADLDVNGTCPPNLAGVRDAFAANFDADTLGGGELGASVAMCIDGELVLNLWAGFTDRARSKPWDERTLVPIFSSTKAVSSVVIARAAGEGHIDYAAPVTDFWPEFGQAGKAGVTVEQALSHQAGLSGFAEPIDPTLWFDWDGLCAELARTAPMWPPGTASGYHPLTWGYLAGEIYRRATGRTIGAALRADFAEPLGLDLWIGLPESEHGRVAQMIKPPGPALLGNLTPIRRAAFLQAWSSPGGRGTADWRKMEIPSANGHATAAALARLMAAMACEGRIDSRAFVAPAAVADASRPRICGQDLVLPFDLCWAAGFLRNDPVRAYGPGMKTIGHSGWGGSCVFADPERRLSFAYVMNRQSTHLLADPRPLRLIEALYASV